MKPLTTTAQFFTDRGATLLTIDNVDVFSATELAPIFDYKSSSSLTGHLRRHDFEEGRDYIKVKASHPEFNNIREALDLSPQASILTLITLRGARMMGLTHHSKTGTEFRDLVSNMAETVRQAGGPSWAAPGKPDLPGAVATVFPFEDTDVPVFEWDGKQVIRVPDVARALGYTEPDSLGRLIRRNAEEFEEGTDIIHITRAEAVSENPVDVTALVPTASVTVLTTEGARLAAMLTRTEMGAAFRRFINRTVIPHFETTISLPSVTREEVVTIASDAGAQAAINTLQAAIPALTEAITKALINGRTTDTPETPKSIARQAEIPEDWMRSGQIASLLNTSTSTVVSAAARLRDRYVDWGRVGPSHTWAGGDTFWYSPGMCKAIAQEAGIPWPTTILDLARQSDPTWAN